jgi:hypothetical protein
MVENEILKFYVKCFILNNKIAYLTISVDKKFGRFMSV